MKFFNCIMVGGESDPYNQIQILDELTFDKFTGLKEKWLKNISFEWLIQGHLVEEKAIKIAESARNSINHRPLLASDLPAPKGMLRIPNNTVY